MHILTLYEYVATTIRECWESTNLPCFVYSSSPALSFVMQMAIVRSQGRTQVGYQTLITERIEVIGDKRVWSYSPTWLQDIQLQTDVVQPRLQSRGVRHPNKCSLLKVLSSNKTPLSSQEYEHIINSLLGLQLGSATFSISAETQHHTISAPFPVFSCMRWEMTTVGLITDTPPSLRLPLHEEASLEWMHEGTRSPNVHEHMDDADVDDTHDDIIPLVLHTLTPNAQEQDTAVAAASSSGFVAFGENPQATRSNTTHSHLVLAPSASYAPFGASSMSHSMRLIDRSMASQDSTSIPTDLLLHLPLEHTLALPAQASLVMTTAAAFPDISLTRAVQLELQHVVPLNPHPDPPAAQSLQNQQPLAHQLPTVENVPASYHAMAAQESSRIQQVRALHPNLYLPTMTHSVMQHVAGHMTGVQHVQHEQPASMFQPNPSIASPEQQQSRLLAPTHTPPRIQPAVFLPSAAVPRSTGGNLLQARVTLRQQVGYCSKCEQRRLYRM